MIVKYKFQNNVALCQAYKILLVLLILIGIESSLVAQQLSNQSNEWEKIYRADAKIKKSHVSWDVKISNAPHKIANINRYVATHSDLMSQQHVDPQEIKAVERFERSNNAQMSGGWLTHLQFNFEWDGNNFFCDVPEMGMTGAKIEPSSLNQQAHAINFVYGANSVSLNGVGSSTPKEGIVARSSTEFLPNAANLFADPVFLIGLPVSKYFSPKDTIITVGQANTIVLVKSFPNLLTGGTNEYINFQAKLVLSKSTYRPLSMEVTNPVTGKRVRKYTLLGYQNYPENIQFASHVVIDEGGQIQDCNLIKASFNGAASLTHIQAGLLPGIMLNDYRFPDHPVRYTIRHNYLPSDQEVMALVRKQQLADEQARKDLYSQVGKSVSIVLFPLVFAVTIIFWMIRSRRKLTLK